jgi:hypothetical protein
VSDTWEAGAARVILNVVRDSSRLTFLPEEDRKEMKVILQQSFPASANA